MSAFTGILNSRGAYLMTDGLGYVDQNVTATRLHKATRIGDLRAVVANVGIASLCEVMADILDWEFDSFDEIVESGLDVMKQTFFRVAQKVRSGDAVSMIVLAGWHEHAQRPGMYSMNLTVGDKARSQQRWLAGDGPEDEDFVLLPSTCPCCPFPGPEAYRESGFDFAADFNKVVPEDYLLHQMEMQRRMKMRDGLHYVGGHAELTSITREGVETSVVHVWDEDRAGALIQPAPINWKAWRASREAKRLAAVNVDGLSRLQRERMLKKAKKGTLR